MASTVKKEESGFLIPGVVDAGRLPRGVPIAIFVKGLDAYTLAAPPTVEVRGSDGVLAQARFHGAEAGRLFSLAQRFMHQAATVVQTTGQPLGGNFQDVTFFAGIRETYGDAGVDPVAAYTVLIVTLDP